MIDKKNYSLKAHNTFGIDAQCDRFIEYSSVSELQQFLADRPVNVPLLSIGQGSNILFTQDFHGIVLHSAIKGINLIASDSDTVLVEAGAGEVWDDFVSTCIKRGYYGIENLSLIPGEVGASAIQNIGAYGVEAKDSIEAVTAIDIEHNRIVILDKTHCRYAYRSSRFKTDWKGRYIITHVLYRLHKTFQPNLEYGALKRELSERNLNVLTAQTLREVIIDIRRSKLPDPKQIGSAGSFFMNPIISSEQFELLRPLYPDMPHYDMGNNRVKVPAGWMIEQLGWKGRRVGCVGVYSKQALVIVNYGGASGDDVARLSQRIQQDVQKHFGIEIKPEVIWIG